MLRRRSAGRRRAQRRAAHLRRKSCSSSKAAARPKSGRKAGKKHDVRMAEGLAVLHSAQRLSPLHQRDQRAGAAAVRHDRAEHDEPRSTIRDFIFNCPFIFTDRFAGGDDYLQAERRHRARSGARPRHAAHQSHSRHRQLRAAARQPPLARLSAHRAAHGRQPLLSCGSASTRPAAIPRRTSTCSAAVLICLKGKGYTYTWPADLGTTPWKDGKATRSFRGRTTSRSGWCRPRR